MTVLAIGKNSFLARSWAAQSSISEHVRFVHHGAIGDPECLREVETVVNFAEHAEAEDRPLRPEEDVAGRVADWLADMDCRLVLLSSRQVYGPSDAPRHETDAPAPVQITGRNKLQSERLATERLGDRVTILRCANIVGYERDAGRKRFMAMLLRSLARDGVILLDISRDTKKDFLPDTGFADILDNVVRRPVPGIFNVGSGIATPVGQIADWVIEGYGSGTVEDNGSPVRDAFSLDVERLTATFGPPACAAQLRDRCRAIGTLLKNEVASGGPGSQIGHA